MNTPIKTLALTVYVAGLTACASTPIPFLPRNGGSCLDVHAGMTYNQVTEILGQPVKKMSETQTAIGVLESYYYTGGNHINFTDGKVLSVSCR